MRRLNIPLLGILFAATLLVGGALYGIHEWQIGRNFAGLLREARAAKENKDWTGALNFYRMYLSAEFDKDAEPYAEMGEVLLVVGDKKEAIKEFEAAVRIDPNLIEPRRQLVKLLLERGRLLDAKTHLDAILQESPRETEFLETMAEIDVRERHYDDAARRLQKAIEVDPKRLESVGKLAVLLAGRLDQPDRAADLLDEMVKKNSDNPKAYIVRGEYFLVRARNPVSNKTPADSAVKLTLSKTNTENETGDAAEEKEEKEEKEDDKGSTGLPTTGIEYLNLADADAERALTLDPDGEPTLKFAIKAKIASRKFSDVVPLAQKGVDLFPSDVEFYLSMAQVKRYLKLADEGVEWLEKAGRVAPEKAETFWELANALLDANRIEELDPVIDRLKKLDYPKPLFLFLEARKTMIQKNWGEAKEAFQKIRPGLGEWPTIARQCDFFFASCCEQLGEYDLQLIAYRKAEKASPGWIQAQWGIARALTKTGKINEALEIYRRTLSFPGASTDPLLGLTRLQIIAGFRAPKDARQWNSYRKSLDRIQEVEPKNFAAKILKAETFVAEKKIGDAARLLQEEISQNPTSVELALAMAELAGSQQNRDAESALLEQTAQAAGNNFRVRLDQARQLVATATNPAEALKKFEQDGPQFGEADLTALYVGLTPLYLAVGAFEDAERLCHFVAERQPNNIRIRSWQFDLAYRTGNADRVEQVVAALKKDLNSDPLTLYCRAAQLALRARQEGEREHLDEALKLLGEARQLRPSWSRIPYLMGQIIDANGDEMRAMPLYQEALFLGERVPGLFNRVIGILFQRRRFAEGDALLLRIHDLPTPFSYEMFVAVSEYSMRTCESEPAYVFRGPPSDSNTADECIHLGHLFAAQGNDDQAEAILRKAVEIAPKSTEAWGALIEQLGRLQQMEKVDAALEQAKSQINPAEFPLFMVAVNESLDRIDDADARLSELAAAPGAGFPAVFRRGEFLVRHGRLKQAEPLFEKMLEQTAGLKENELNWARRNLATILMARGTAVEVKRAQQLIDENLKQNSNSELDQRFQALILANSKDKKQKAEGAEKLEYYLTSHKSLDVEGRAEIRLTLAGVYAALNDFPKANSHLLSLITESPKNPRYLSAYISLLTTRGEIVDAEARAEDLLKLNPDLFSSVVILADLRFRLARYSAVSDLFKNYVAKVPKDEQARLARLRDASLQLDAFARRAAVVDTEDARKWSEKYREQSTELYRNFTAGRERSAIELAVFLSRQGKHVEALDLLEKEFDSARPPEIATITSSLIGSRTATEADFDRAEKLLREAVAKDEKVLALKVALADQLFWRDRVQEAELLYRELLKVQENHPGVLNNFALLLAYVGRGKEGALDYIDKTIKITGPSPMILESRGTILFLTGDLQGAAADLTKSIAAQPSGVAHFHLAQVQLKQGLRSAAIESLKNVAKLKLQAIELHPRERDEFARLMKMVEVVNASN